MSDAANETFRGCLLFFAAFHEDLLRVSSRDDAKSNLADTLSLHSDRPFYTSKGVESGRVTFIANVFQPRWITPLPTLCRGWLNQRRTSGTVGETGRGRRRPSHLRFVGAV
jgi:hypothetical protein